MVLARDGRRGGTLAADAMADMVVEGRSGMDTIVDMVDTMDELAELADMKKTNMTIMAIYRAGVATGGMG